MLLKRVVVPAVAGTKIVSRELGARIGTLNKTPTAEEGRACEKSEA